MRGLESKKLWFVVLSLVLAGAAQLSAQNQGTIWPSTEVPSISDVGADSTVELGVTFKADTDGYVTGLRYYKSAANTGQHVGHLWSNSGALLASVTFSGETASGWQSATFPTPVFIKANSIYVASYLATAGHWSVSWGYFATTGVDNPPLHALADVSGTPNGRFAYGGATVFPKSTHQSANYWVDVVFVAGAAAAAPAITAQPANGTVTVGQTASFSVSATGTAPLSYQWRKNGAAISGATTSTYTTPATALADSGALFSVVVSNSAGSVTSAAAQLTVSGALQVSTSQLPSGTMGGAYSTPLAASGGATPYSWSLLSGSLPNGLVLNTAGTIWGTPTAAGLSSFTVRVSDASGQSVSKSLSISIATNNASDCTLFASASGNDGNAGTSAAAPKTFAGAAARTRPGSIVCLLAGTYAFNDSFSPPVSGTPSAWIVYKAYGDGPVTWLWTAGAIGQPIVKLGTGTFPSNPAYLEFRGLTLDGQNTALDGFLCAGAHHLRFIGNRIDNTGGSGIGAGRCDYLTSDGNLINHNGYLYGWSSAISYNSTQWFDGYSGFHNIIANNIITGEYDGSVNHTDGNGIILDLSSGSYDYTTANTPPVLVVNNVVYGNGGRCIHAYVVTNFWVVNNTCYKNNLDPSLGNAGSLTAINAHDGYFINNITVAWHTNNPAFYQGGTIANIRYATNLYFGSSLGISGDPAQFLQADPLFVNPPFFDPQAPGQYATALAPSLLGTGLTLLPLSPAYNRGIDPSTLPGLPAALVTDLRRYIYTDITGAPRTPGGPFDLGAYQH